MATALFWLASLLLLLGIIAHLLGAALSAVLALLSVGYFVFAAMGVIFYITTRFSDPK